MGCGICQLHDGVRKLHLAAAVSAPDAWRRQYVCGATSGERASRGRDRRSFAAGGLPVFRGREQECRSARNIREVYSRSGTITADSGQICGADARVQEEEIVECSEAGEEWNPHFAARPFPFFASADDKGL